MLNTWYVHVWEDWNWSTYWATPGSHPHLCACTCKYLGERYLERALISVCSPLHFFLLVLPLASLFPLLPFVSLGNTVIKSSGPGLITDPHPVHGDRVAETL